MLGPPIMKKDSAGPSDIHLVSKPLLVGPQHFILQEAFLTLRLAAVIKIKEENRCDVRKSFCDKMLDGSSKGLFHNSIGPSRACQPMEDERERPLSRHYFSGSVEQWFFHVNESWAL